MPVYTLTRRGGRTKRDPLFSLRAVRGLYLQAGSLQVQNESEQRLIEFCQENALVIGNTLFQQHKRRLYTSLDSQH